MGIEARLKRLESKGGQRLSKAGIYAALQRKGAREAVFWRQVLIAAFGHRDNNIPPELEAVGGMSDLWEPSQVALQEAVVAHDTAEQKSADQDVIVRWLMSRGLDPRTEKRREGGEIVDVIEALEPELERRGIKIWTIMEAVLAEQTQEEYQE